MYVNFFLQRGYVALSESQWYPRPQKDETTKAKPKRYIMDYGNCTISFTLSGLEDPGPLVELPIL